MARSVDPRQGGSMIYVIMLMAMLAIMSTGFLYMSHYSLESVLHNREYMEAQATAKMIHQSFCMDVSGGSSAAMNRIWEEFEEDGLMMAESGDGEDILEALKRKEYSAEGRGENADLTVEITLTARPGNGEATVTTRVTRHGFTFSLGADIRFDDTDGETLIIPLPQKDESGEGGADTGEEGMPEGGSQEDSAENGTPDSLCFYMRGLGVYRYYEGSGSQ